MLEAQNLFGGVVTCLALLALGLWLLRFTKTHQTRLAFQSRLFIVALTARFVSSIAIYQFGLWTVLGDSDATGWLFGDSIWHIWQSNNYNFLDVLLSWKSAFQYFGTAGEGPLGRAPHVGYYYLLGTFFYLIGASSRMIAAAINCFIGSMIVIFAYRTARTLFSEWVAVRVAWWTCLFPSMIVWSAQTVKEPVVILLEVITVYCCVRLRKSGFSARYVILGGFTIALMVPFRFYAAYIGAAAFAIVLLVPNAQQHRQRRWSLFGISAFIVTTVTVAAILANTETRLDRFDMDFIQQFRHNIAEGTGSGVELDVDMRTTTGFSVGTFVGAAHLLLAPFPWQLGGGSLRMLSTMPEIVYWWWLFFVGVVPGLRIALRRNATEMLPMLVFVIGLGMLYSMTFGNVGVVFRQRAQLLPWLFMFAGVGLEQRAFRRASRTLRYMPAAQHT